MNPLVQGHHGSSYNIYNLTCILSQNHQSGDWTRHTGMKNLSHYERVSTSSTLACHKLLDKINKVDEFHKLLHFLCHGNQRKCAPALRMSMQGQSVWWIQTGISRNLPMEERVSPNFHLHLISTTNSLEDSWGKLICCFCTKLSKINALDHLKNGMTQK